MSRIRPFIGNELIKVLTGIRRSGKSVMPVYYTHLDVYKRQQYRLPMQILPHLLQLYLLLLSCYCR